MLEKVNNLFIRAANKNNLNESLFKDLGNFVMLEIKEKINKPDNLITKIKGLGRWYPRNRRMLDYFSRMGKEISYLDNNPERKIYLTEKKEHWENKIFPIYKDFLDYKKEVKKKKNEYKINMENIIQEG